MPTNRKTIKTLGSSRVIRLTGEIDDEAASKVIDQLIKFDKKSGNDILLIIDSPGGDIDATISIYQIIKLLRCDVSTLALSNACSAAGVLLACGATNKRMVMEHSIVMLHAVSQAMGEDYHGCLESELTSLKLSKNILIDILLKHKIKNPERFLKPEATYVNSKEAVEIGFADHIVSNISEVFKLTNI
jgi:ATP-dependent Clp protease, protease subunit